MKKENLSQVYYLLKRNSSKIKGSNNKVIRTGAFLSQSSIKILGDDNEVIIKKGARLYKVNIIVMGSNQQIIIDSDCNIKNSVLWLEDTNCLLEIGKKTTVEGAHIAVSEPNSNIKIGEDCMFSSGIDIRNGDSHSIIDMETNKRINYAKDIHIGNHVWLGANVQILKGVSIGDNSVIGVRSIVTKNIASNSVATGAPARVVKENVTWDRKRIYEQ